MVMGKVSEVLYLQSRISVSLNIGRLNNKVHTEEGVFIKGSVKHVLPKAQRERFISACFCESCFAELTNDWSFMLTIKSPYRKIFASRFKGKRKSVKMYLFNDYVSECVGRDYETIFNELNSETPAPALRSDT